MEPLNMDEINSRLQRAVSSNKSSQSDGSSFGHPQLDYEVLTAPSTRPCSWIWESEFMLVSLPSSPLSSSGVSTPPPSTPTPSSPLQSLPPASLPTPDTPKFDMSDPMSPIPDMMILTQQEVQRRWERLRPAARAHFQALAERGAECRADLSDSEEVWSTSGERMRVKQALAPELFRKWSWASASSRRSKTEASENEDVYDEDEEDDSSSGPSLSSGFFLGPRDSIDVARESRGRRSSFDEFYRWSEDTEAREDSSTRGSLAQGLRRVGQKIINVVQSRRASPQPSGNNTSNNSDDENEEDGDKAGDARSSAPDASPKASKPTLMEFVKRRFSRPSQPQQQWRQPKHEPCHRVRLPNAPLLKNANEPAWTVPLWSDRIGPKNELLDDLRAPLGDRAVTTNTTDIICPKIQKCISPGLWFSGHC